MVLNPLNVEVFAIQYEFNILFIFQHSCIYVQRSGRFKETRAAGQLQMLVKNKTPVSTLLVNITGVSV